MLDFLCGVHFFDIMRHGPRPGSRGGQGGHGPGPPTSRGPPPAAARRAAAGGEPKKIIIYVPSQRRADNKRDIVFNFTNCFIFKGIFVIYYK